MKKTLLLLVALFTMGGVTLNAQEDEVLDFDASFYHAWSEVSGTATDNGVFDKGGMKLGEEVAMGETIWGDLSNAVHYLHYANITEYSELRFEGTPGAVIRLMCNRLVDEGPIYEIKPKIGDDGKLTVSINDLKYLNGGTSCDFVCLQSIKVPAGWQGGTTNATITSVKIVKPADPLANDKTTLKNAINNGNLRNSYGKTSASWSALTSAITAGEAELTNASATAASLSAATKAINDAISGLALQAGYTNLTAAMFKQHETFGGAEMGTAGCAYDVFKSTGMPYGDGSVGWLNYADLSGYDKLIVVATAGKPRFCMNRLESGGQQAETQAASKMLDINPNNAYTWSTEKYQTVESGVYIVDLKEIVKDYGFAYLHSIKGANYVNVTVSDMLLYKDPTVTLTSSAELEGYKTFYNKTDNYEVDAKTTIYKASAASTTSVTLEAVAGNIVPKNTPVVLKTTAADYKITLSPTTATATGDFTGNQLYAAEAEAKNAYILAYTTADGLGFFKYTDALEAGHVCVTVPALAPVRLSLDVDGEATAISEVATKVAEEGAAYNLAGQPVGADYKGIVIKNGKKFLQK